MAADQQAYLVSIAQAAAALQNYDLDAAALAEIKRIDSDLDSLLDAVLEARGA